MSESERLERYKRTYKSYNYNENDSEYDENDSEAEDEALANRIIALLNNDKIDKYCMVDAYYYDFSVIPRTIQEELNIYRDAYLIFGISEEAEIISKWVDRWDLDSSAPIVYGKVIHPEPKNCCAIPEIRQNFDKHLLSTPQFKIFGDINGA